MPRYDQDNAADENMDIYSIHGSSMKFSAVRPDLLGSSEYTLVTAVIDVTGSVRPFAKSLLECLKSIVSACGKCERSENLLLRVVTFNSKPIEVHGFKEFHTISPDDYDSFECTGMTALYDACFSSIEASNSFGAELTRRRFNVNAAIYIITDGDDNISSKKIHHVKEAAGKAVAGEMLESSIITLIMLKDPNLTDQVTYDENSKKLDAFVKEADLTEFINFGEATPQKLAKLADWVSKSVSAQSSQIGTGAPSKPLPLTF